MRFSTSNQTDSEPVEEDLLFSGKSASTLTLISGGEMKRKTTLTYLLLPFFCVALVVLSPRLASAQARTAAKSGKEVYRGAITYIGGPRPITDFFTLTINSFTPDNDIRRFTDILRSEGRSDFWEALGKEKRGTIQIGARLALDLNAVWVTQTEEGRKISALAERWLGFGELRRGARSVDYPFTYIELWVEEDGDVEGTLFPAARVRAKSGNSIEVENFGIYPARLTNIKQRRK